MEQTELEKKFIKLNAYVLSERNLTTSEWAIGINCLRKDGKAQTGTISNARKNPDKYPHQTQKIYDKTLEWLNIEVQSDGTFAAKTVHLEPVSETINKPESNVNSANETRTDPTWLGVWKGYFLRIDEYQMSELIMIMYPDGKMRMFTDDTIRAGFDFEGVWKKKKAILRGYFIDKSVEDNYDFQLVLRLPTMKNECIEGLYSGTLSTRGDNLPLGGKMRFHQISKWNLPETGMFELYNKQRPVSFELLDDKIVTQLLETKKNDILFFMGFREPDKKIKSVWIENIHFFMTTGLIPKFSLDASAFAGTYISWRLGGEKRDYLMGRLVEIHDSGNVRLTYKDNIYYGKCHFFESDNHYHKLIFTIDKKIKGVEKVAPHRSHYVFVTEHKKKPEDAQFLFGISAILSQHDKARVGEEVIVKCAELPDDVNKLDIKAGTPEDIAKMTTQQREIFRYLQKGVVIKIKRQSSQKVERLEEEINWGKVLFESAYYKADLKIKELGDKQESQISDEQILNQLEQAFNHGFASENADERNDLRASISPKAALHAFKDFIAKKVKIDDYKSH
jgi:hypothetical protein